MSIAMMIRMGAIASAFAVVAPVAAKEGKAIRLREQTPTSQIAVAVQQTRAVYKINEPIRLRAKLNRTGYVYVYTRDADSKYLTLLYPARATDQNKLAAGRWAVIPPKQEFFGDEPGIETLVVVATPRPINLSARYFSEAGKFMRAPSAAATAAFAEKGIRLRDQSARPDADPGQKTIKVKIIR